MHGKATAQYISYNIKDVDATYSLYLKAKEEFSDYGLDISITKVYSPASIGKALLKMMGIRPFLDKNNGGCISNEVLGYVTSTYIGGRSEVRVRKEATLVTLIDFTSMYPTMCILLGLWDYLTCNHIEQLECTKEVTDFVNTVTHDDLRKKETWAGLDAIVQIEADEDILPIRAKFDNKLAYNIGDCYVTAGNGLRLWYALADVINSKLRTGKTPKIVRAIKFIAVGKQEGLQPIALFGKIIDPFKDNMFEAVIEQRKHIQQTLKECTDEREKALLEKKQKALKIVANATSYGIFMEINTQEREAEVTAYGLETKRCRVNKVEEFGKQSHPLVAAFITSAARLVLGIGETILDGHKAVHSMCDTDSLAVPPQHVKEIQEFFSGLNPYSFDAALFKVEEYEDEHKKKHPLENISLPLEKGKGGQM